MKKSRLAVAAALATLGAGMGDTARRFGVRLPGPGRSHMTWQEQFEQDRRAVGPIPQARSSWTPKRPRCSKLIRNKSRAKLLAWKGGPR